MNANQEAAFLVCAACDSRRASDNHSDDSSEEVSELRGEGNAEGHVLTQGGVIL